MRFRDYVRAIWPPLIETVVFIALAGACLALAGTGAP